MPEDALTRQKILDAAQKRMVKFGYRKVTMDEIAQDLGMSKNTIYRQFVSKEEIAQSLLKRLQQEINTGLDAIKKTQKDPLKIFSDSVVLLRKQLAPWFEHFFREIPAELPHLWDEFVRYRNEKILNIRELVELGIKKGIFRNINQSVAVQAYLGAVKTVVNPKFLEEEKLNFSEALELVLDIWANGILVRRKGK